MHIHVSIILQYQYGSKLIIDLYNCICVVLLSKNLVYFPKFKKLTGKDIFYLSYQSRDKSNICNITSVFL